MRRNACIIVVLAAIVGSLANGEPGGAGAAAGLASPVGIAIGPDGRVFVSDVGAPGKDDDGAIATLEDGKPKPFATGLNDPRGLATFQQWLFVADKDQVWRVGMNGNKETYAAAAAFPTVPRALHGLAADPESGLLYVSDAGDGQGEGAAIYRVTPQRKVELVIDRQRWPELRSPRGVVLDGATHLLVLDHGTGALHRVNLANRGVERVADGLGGASGLAWDKFGRLYLTDAANGKLFAIPRPGSKPVEVAHGLRSPGDPCVDPSGKHVLVAETGGSKVGQFPASIPGHEVDETPLPLESAVAFPNLKWTGWEPQSDAGVVTPLRPIVLTHAGDGSNRVFVATEHGVIHVFPNDQQAVRTKVFLDLQKLVKYRDDENEEGFLGLAFHPNYKANGEFFVFYTVKQPRFTNVLSRFRVSKDDPNRADPTSEEELFRITRPFWNHDGGTICFGPDGYLYLALGDGGAANDPFGHGQNLKTLLGTVLRIDVNRADPGKKYAVPADNPFVGRAGAQPEIWAYGLRNVWRMAFDRSTGKLWAADVGQNLYEEINLLTAGGNYGWNRREGLHPFGPQGTGPRPEFIEPIWEYHHDVGKSITGGAVYRGERLPALQGHYVYGDYVSGKIWGLRYDEKSQRVVANRPIRDRNLPLLSFGEDERGESYYLTYTPTGQGIYWFVASER